MPNYEVTLERVVKSETTLTVEASSEEEAATLAKEEYDLWLRALSNGRLERLGGDESRWSETGDECDVTGVSD